MDFFLGVFLYFIDHPLYFNLKCIDLPLHHEIMIWIQIRILRSLRPDQAGQAWPGQVRSPVMGTLWPSCNIPENIKKTLVQNYVGIQWIPAGYLALTVESKLGVNPQLLHMLSLSMETARNC